MTLQLRALVNCYLSEPNSVVLALFQDGKAQPVALLAEPLVPNEMNLVDKEVSVPVESSSAPPAFEIHVGLAHPRGVLFLNHTSEANDVGSVTSCFRFRWMPE